MEHGLFLALGGAAISVGALHTLAPDHWLPFAALARAQGWSAGRTARVTFLCGFGHVTVSALLGLLGLAFGRAVFESAGQKMEAVAGILLIGFGLAYGVWGLRRAAGRRVHGHAHAHYDHVHDASKTTAWSLFLLFSADPCVAVIPLLFAAAPLGAAPDGGHRPALRGGHDRHDDRARSAGARRRLAASASRGSTTGATRWRAASSRRRASS